MWNLKILTALAVLAMALCGSGAATAFDAKHLMKFKALNACEGCDLSEANLSGANRPISYSNQGNIFLLDL